MCDQFMDAEAETLYMYMYPSNHHFKAFLKYMHFSPCRKLVPFIKDSKYSRLFLQFTEAKLYSIYVHVPLLIYKIDSQN